MGAHRIFNYPGWRDNAYVQLLQAGAVDAGWELAGRPDLFEALVELTTPERGGVVHVQWPSPVTEQADSDSDAFRRADLFADAVYSAKQWGRPIVWTIHNVLPHDTRFPRAATQLHAALARHADAVHALTPRTAELASEAYDIDPEKIVLIPHSSYAGVYGPEKERAAARAELGIDDDRSGVLFFGWIRPYKGVEHLADAIEVAAAAGADLDVLLAGRMQGGVDDTVQRILDGPAHVTSHLARVDDEDVPTWFGAADVLVLPYRGILNSGAMFLAATYGTPVILPDEDHLVDQYGGEAWIRFFRREDPAASIAALLSDDWFRSDEAIAAARAFADARPPQAMADAYLDLLTRLSSR